MGRISGATTPRRLATAPSTLKLHSRSPTPVPHFRRKSRAPAVLYKVVLYKAVLDKKEEPCTTVNSDAPVGRFRTSALAHGPSAAHGAVFRTTSPSLRCTKPSTAERILSIPPTSTAVDAANV